MGKNLYVGNLSPDVTEAQLQALFTEIGETVSVKIITDRISGQSRGFAFVEMVTQEAAAEAIEKLNNHSLDDRIIVVNEAHPKKERSDRGRGRNPRRDRY